MPDPTPGTEAAPRASPCAIGSSGTREMGEFCVVIGRRLKPLRGINQAMRLPQIR
ncbi:hypothetical protein SORBI_3002G230201 [Sorghum bicolor]|uniref:Uncharacterized protein n=1 Tax=Sorghum bicolor TaxID=4558 RepID=A0A1W0W5I8_SORBI|nr:hypothetical protein SORBI_3002G230201 [Sorghum bicolor]